MSPKHKTIMNIHLIGMCSFSLVNLSSAEEINWNRADNATNASQLDFTSASSGTFDTSDTVYLFHSGSPGEFYDAPDGPETNIALTGPARLYSGGSISSSYSFNYLFTDANLPIFNAWQYNDYKVEVFGGDATISAAGVTQGKSGANDLGIEGTDYEIIGEGTSSITLNALNGSTEGANSFYGSLQVTGSFNGIKFTQMFDKDRARTSGDGAPETSLDTLTRTRITGITSAESIPEPSSTLLLFLSSTVLMLRRNRN